MSALGDALQESLMIGAEHEDAHRLPKQRGIGETRAPSGDMLWAAQQRESAQIGAGDGDLVWRGTVHEGLNDLDAEDLVADAVPLEDLPAAHLRMMGPDETGGVEVGFEAGADIARQTLADQADQPGLLASEGDAVSRVRAAAAEHAHAGAPVGIDDVVDAVVHSRISRMSSVHWRNSRCSRFGACNSSVAVCIPLLPVATRRLRGLCLRLWLRLLLWLCLRLRLRLLLYRLRLLSYWTGEYHANRRTAQQRSFKRGSFATIHCQSIFEFDVDDRVRVPADVQCRSPFCKVLAALLMSVHTWRCEREIQQVIGKGSTCSCAGAAKPTIVCF